MKPWHAWRRAAPWVGGCALTALVAPALAELPERMPLPPMRPAAEPPPEAPVPEPPADPEIPVPTRRPEQSKVGAPMKNPPPGARHDPAPMPAGELACRARLRELGVRFEERERLASEDGCLVAHPIAVTALSGTVAITPEAVLNCATAQTAAEFVAEVVSPGIEAAFGSPLAEIRHGSAYVCRTRHNQAKMSEHAFGNAIDFSAFELKDGTVIEVKAYGPADRDRGEFLRRLRGAACGPFKTVLGPGTDADHAYHLHFDLQQRRRGGTYCK